ncbi:MAG TPA: hypothetical protein VJZ71_12940 [Phycisphaerae bacterium]|nr:hypothetical protein [Phycisphaerae bacterium]
MNTASRPTRTESDRSYADECGRHFRTWPAWLRIALSAALTTLLAWPLGGYLWTLYDLKPYDPITNADPECASGPTGDWLDWMAAHTWRWSIGLPEALCAGLAAIAIYSLLTHWRGPQTPVETQCRRCHAVLRALPSPRCPECGESI